MTKPLAATSLCLAVIACATSGFVAFSSSGSRNAAVPELGESMNTLARRMASLHFALEARNQALSAYELEEVHETLEDLIAVPRTEHGVDLPKMLEALDATQVRALREAVASGKFDAAKKAYRDTVAACNACHVATEHAFIVIVEPRGFPVVNRDWATPAPGPR